MSKVILGGESGRGPEPLPAAAVARVIAAPLFAFGLVLIGVATVDLGFLWVPFQFGKGEWEFGVISRTFDSLAIVTTGFVFLTVAAGLKNTPWLLRLVSVLGVLGFLLLLTSFALYMLNVPVAMQQIPNAARSNLMKAVVRTSLFALLYITLYGFLTWFAWRLAGAARRGVTR